jgi:hypothetical protein
MSNVYMVRWQDVVGKDNLDKFTAMQKGVTYAEQKNISEEEALSKALKGGMSEEDIQMWRKKRQMLRHCGYELDDKITRIHGWYRAKLNSNGQLVWYMDTTTRNPKPFIEYISMQAWLDWYKGYDVTDTKVYNVQSVINRTTREISKPKERADIDDVFVEEA